ECLETLVRLMAPISPFFSDALFINLNKVTQRFSEASVHHVLYPTANAQTIDADLEERMQLAQDVCSLVLSLRKKVNIKVRQPLQKLMIPVLNPHMQVQLQKVENLIKAEVNVKEIAYLTETEGVIKKKIKANFKTLGAKLGALMKEAANNIAAFSQHQIADLEADGNINITLSNNIVNIGIADVEITAEDIPGWSVANKGAITVALDVTITPELLLEGNARELINRIQNIRKEMGLALTDRIQVEMLQNENMQPTISTFKNYICSEILADDIVIVPNLETLTAVDVNEQTIQLAVKKQQS
ncbi:MAG: DUF5915 domain-containing protein, partial [Chitinophagaceae bacterium]